MIRKGIGMEWLNDNSKGLGFAVALLGGFVGWMTRLEVRLSRAATKDEMNTSLGKIYDIMRKMGEDVARICGYCEHRHNED